MCKYKVRYTAAIYSETDGMAWLHSVHYNSNLLAALACFADKKSLRAIWAMQDALYTMYQRWVVFFSFFSTDFTHYWVFGCPNSEALPIGMLCLRISKQTLQPITLLFLYLAKDSLSHRQQQMGLNTGLEANCITLRLPP